MIKYILLYIMGADAGSGKRQVRRSRVDRAERSVAVGLASGPRIQVGDVTRRGGSKRKYRSSVSDPAKSACGKCLRCAYKWFISYSIFVWHWLLCEFHFPVQSIMVVASQWNALIQIIISYGNSVRGLSIAIDHCKCVQESTFSSSVFGSTNLRFQGFRQNSWLSRYVFGGKFIRFLQIQTFGRCR